MKIGIDVRFWRETGVGRYTRNLVVGLSKIDKKNEYFLFYSPRDLGEIEKFIKVDNFKLIPADIPWHTLTEQTSFPSLLKKYDLDLMHFPYFSLPVFYSRKYVVTIHDLILHHFSTGRASTLPTPIYHLKRLGYKFVMREGARKAEKIISVSSATKKEIEEHLNVSSKKISVIYEGVDAALKPVGDALKEKYFLYVGNTYPHKNLDILLFAFSSLSKTDTKLYIVGRKDFFQERLKKKAAEYKNPNVFFLEDVSDSRLAGLYQNALALVAPSLMEGFGLPLLEAMQEGCLVLASNIPAHKEICKDAAIYFDPRDREDLSQKMQDVSDNRLNRQGFVKKGENRAKYFSWEKMARETLNVYNSC